MVVTIIRRIFSDAWVLGGGEQNDCIYMILIPTKVAQTRMDARSKFDLYLSSWLQVIQSTLQ